ncbi:porin [Vibrio ostreicida]|uniref:Porin n=1 Tax=Vibrio ostreicida TaxID=526588 RepID=A0ABT8BV71_9VIBR|nr:porin [Vibrio ostreicida]MDN3610012.1 porin [Vibrio ostreicida]NPD10437.1 porin [Vibrio ostreicida]
MIQLGKTNKITLVLSSVCLIYSDLALAEIDWRGYATIAGGRTFENRDYDTLTDELRIDKLSVVGLQGSSDLSDGLSATVQLVARGKDDFDPEFEWAYVKYQYNDNLDIKFGRLRAPFYYYSEYLDVSYAYNWISPPIEVYASNVTNYDGINVFYANNVGDFDYSVYLGSGTRNVTLTAGDLSGTYNIISNFDVSYGDFKAKLIYSQFDISLTSTTLVTVQSSFTDLPGAFVIEDMGGHIAGVAGYYDPGEYYLGVEYAEVRFDDDVISISEDDRFLATVGYRISDYTLHYSYSTSDKSNGLDRVSTSDSRYSTAKQVADAVLSEDQTHIVGVRYDFHSNAALKFEYGYTDNDYTDQDTQFFRTGVSIIF